MNRAIPLPFWFFTCSCFTFESSHFTERLLCPFGSSRVLVLLLNPRTFARLRFFDGTGLGYNILAGAAGAVASAAASAASAGKKRARLMEHARSFDPFSGSGSSSSSPGAGSEGGANGSKHALPRTSPAEDQILQQSKGGKKELGGASAKKKAKAAA